MRDDLPEYTVNKNRVPPGGPGWNLPAWTIPTWPARARSKKRRNINPNAGVPRRLLTRAEVGPLAVEQVSELHA